MGNTTTLIGVKDSVEKNVENRAEKSICFKNVLDCVAVWTMSGSWAGCADCKICTMGK